MPARRIGLQFLAIALVACGSAVAQKSKSEFGQYAPPDAYADDPEFAYYGSENEWTRRMFSAKNADFDYKRRGQRLLLALLDGNPKKCVKMCQADLVKTPDNPETLFVLACAWDKLGDASQAVAAARKAVVAGMPPERFLAGPVELLTSVAASPEFRQLLGDRRPGIVHGPMLGAVTPHSARVWIRTATEQPATLRVYRSASDPAPFAVAAAVTSAADDRTAVFQVDGLEPDSEYYYDIAVDGDAAWVPRTGFRTAPPAGQPGKLRVAFGGCAGYTPQFERMWTVINQQHPAAMLMMGDNVYIDLPEEPGAFHRYSYYCRQSRPEWRQFVAATPIYAVWDDHDAGTDDIWFGPYVDRPAWKPGALKLFKQNWNNPAYGSATAPGCWYRFALGDVDFFMLDCRYYRTNPFASPRTMLGPEQKKWLLDELQKSQATFKVVASSVPWAPEAKPASHDTWDGFPEEREEIFAAIDARKIGGVLLLSGDRHRSDVWKIERPAGYALYDICSSRLTNIHTHDCVPGTLFCYNEKCSFGLFNFDTQAADPQVSVEFINIDGQPVYKLEIARSELQPK